MPFGLGHNLAMLALEERLLAAHHIAAVQAAGAIVDLGTVAAVVADQGMEAGLAEDRRIAGEDTVPVHKEPEEAVARKALGVRGLAGREAVVDSPVNAADIGPADLKEGIVGLQEDMADLAVLQVGLAAGSHKAVVGLEVAGSSPGQAAAVPDSPAEGARRPGNLASKEVAATFR
jgi:hypothetical protein